MKKLLSTERMPALIIAFFLICLVACVALYLFLDGYTAVDLIGHWRICKYTLEGYNPYVLIDEPAPIPSVGTIPFGFSTVPWSCVFGSIFYGGFMPQNWAAVYIFALHFLVLLLLLAVLYRKFNTVLSKKALITVLLLPCVHFSFTYSLHFGNAGGIICYLIIIAFLISREHPIITGILLGVAMMKPQIAAIICLVFLLKRQLLPLFIAAAIVLAGWGATALFTSTPPLQLLAQTFGSGTANSGQYLGLLNNLKFFGVDSTLILLLNMVIGVAYTLALLHYIKKRYPAACNSLFVFVPACIASTFWIYKNGTDYAILTFVSFFFLLLCMKENTPIKDRIGSILSMGYLQMSRCIVYLGIFLCRDNIFVRDLLKSADGVIIAIIGVYLCKLYATAKIEPVLETQGK